VAAMDDDSSGCRTDAAFMGIEDAATAAAAATACDVGRRGAGARIELACTAHPGTSVRRLVKSVIRGLKGCQEPEKAAEGMGGTYFFCNEAGRKVAILKPCDEEPLAPNNPKVG
jgi:hypothetical protein